MDIHYVNLDDCYHVSGAVVVIDVLRAFTTAAFAFHAGVTRILLAGTIDQAFTIKESYPNALLVGEVDGLPIPGFDFGNSPSGLDGLDLAGKMMIQRTSAGVQGVIRCQGASHLLASSFVCAQATAECLRNLNPPEVTFVITGFSGLREGDEDLACAEYIAVTLKGIQPNPAPFLERVRQSYSGKLFSNSSSLDLPSVDLDYAVQVNRFPFAMQVSRQSDLLALERIFP